MAAARRSRPMPGHEVYRLTPDQIAAWRKAAEPLKAKWASQVKERRDAERCSDELQGAS